MWNRGQSRLAWADRGYLAWTPHESGVTRRARACLCSCGFPRADHNGGPIMERFPSNLDRLAPAPWEVETVARRVLAITCEHYRLDPRRVSPDDRLGVEITGDSLDVVEYIMELEEALDV